ncbi:hypothetical protein CKF94_12785 [Vibrio coralliilyticus]|uniref:hypothetical protein n=1 Tax=Vibrio coralliilyticus TaxID=190893 RepID=UPI000BAAEECE|nr:hypothetical protein [Vibrio coralliilyticus]PAU37888.1 hypothetical protein CKF94_12785 [Vibrio coralliilyticus]
MFTQIKKFFLKFWKVFTAIGVLFSVIIPIQQWFFKDKVEIPTSVTNVYQEKSKDLEIWDYSVQITVRDTNRYIFLVPGSLSVFRTVISNNTDKELSGCKVIYQYNEPDFLGGRYLGKEKALPARSYNQLTDLEKFEWKTGAYSLKRPNEFFHFSVNAHSDKELTAVFDPFFSAPHSLKFYVSCEGKVSNKVIIHEEDVSFLHSSLDLPEWYYGISKFFFAPYS